MSMASTAGPKPQTASFGLRLHGLNISTSMGAVATLQRVADESGAPVYGGDRLNVLVPGDRAQNVTVEPGRWLIEATLPSGETISEEVAVEGGQKVEVPLHAPEGSPHEWLGWQHLVGNIEGKKTLQRLYGRARDVVESATNRLESFDVDDLPDTVDNLTERVRRFDRAEFAKKASDIATRTLNARAQAPKVLSCQKKDGLSGADAWAKILAPDLADAKVCAPLVENKNEATWLYEFVGPTALSQRQFAHVEWLGEQFAVSLPLPWRALSDERHVPVQVMVRMHPLQSNVMIGVLAEDHDFAPLAGLMTASTLPKAAVAARQAYNMLFQKELNPLGAAAGGYILLAAGAPEKRDWHSWIDNLNNWFPNIPDGAILKASLRLRFPKDKASADEARTALLDAFDRGIPYYSAGVSWLLDGLTVFADDPEIDKKMKMVQRVALRLDLSQAFTVIRVGEKVKR